ncbi:hypothetical protein PENTCL1PPCAC_29338, partial [Pristionchus entomophagus]
ELLLSLGREETLLGLLGTTGHLETTAHLGLLAFALAHLAGLLILLLLLSTLLFFLLVIIVLGASVPQLLLLLTDGSELLVFHVGSEVVAHCLVD